MYVPPIYFPPSSSAQVTLSFGHPSCRFDLNSHFLHTPLRYRYNLAPSTGLADNSLTAITQPHYPTPNTTSPAPSPELPTPSSPAQSSTSAFGFKPNPTALIDFTVAPSTASAKSPLNPAEDYAIFIVGRWSRCCEKRKPMAPGSVLLST